MAASSESDDRKRARLDQYNFSEWEDDFFAKLDFKSLSFDMGVEDKIEPKNVLTITNDLKNKISGSALGQAVATKSRSVRSRFWLCMLT